ncbi:hypothetical protein BH23VER1_BH23VER1_26270 [soil metagenome]
MEDHQERYEIICKAGQGGAGAVYKARDTQLGRVVALKRLLGSAESEDLEKIGRTIAEEARTLASFSHPHIVTVFDVGTDADGAYVVMEFIDGETLDETIARAPLKTDDFLEVAEQALEALHVAHSAHVLHRDLKPSNLMLTWLASGAFQVKLLDFGLAKFSKSPALQTMDQSNAILGSIYFMAPEQFERQRLTPRTDLYSMGCLFYFCLTGRYPFNGDTAAAVMTSHFSGRVVSLADLRPDLPKPVADWVMWHLNVSPHDRPKSARESLETVRAALAGHDVSAAVAGQPVPPTVIPRPTIISQHTSSVPVIPATARVPRLITGQVAAFRDVVTGQVTIRTGPNTATQAYLERVGSAQKDGRRKLLGVLGTAAGVLVAGLIAYGFLVDSPPPDPTPAAPVAPPVTAGLVAHFDAAALTFSDAHQSPAGEGERVAEWGDLAPGIGGPNPAQYHRTGTPSKTSHWPTLRQISARDADLPRPVRTLEFGGRDRLKIGETPDAEDFGAALAGRSAHFIMVARSRALRGSKSYLFGSAVDGESGEPLSLSFDGGWGKFGPLDFQGRSSAAEARSPGSGFEIISASWDRSAHSLRLTRTGANGTTTGGTPVTDFKVDADLRRLRLGDRWTASPEAGTGFVGDIAEILVYDRALTEDEKSQVVDHLRQKYFARDDL